MYTYMGICDNTTDFPVDSSMTFLALRFLHISPDWLVFISSGNRENAFLDTREQGARADIAKGAWNMKIVIREQGA